MAHHPVEPATPWQWIFGLSKTSMRYRLTLEYDGGPFVGWQRQDNGASVQGVLEDAIQKLSGERVTVTWRQPHRCGRTCHWSQVAHFDLAKEFPADTVRDALNHHVRPHPVAVLESGRNGRGFPRPLLRQRRHYLYRILNRRAPAVLDHGKVWQVAVPLDAEAMHTCAGAGRQSADFTTFRAAECPVGLAQSRRSIGWMAGRRADEIHIEASARSFLHHQIRSFMSTLKLVGEGKWSPSDVADALAARDRRRCGQTRKRRRTGFISRQGRCQSKYVAPADINIGQRRNLPSPSTHSLALCIVAPASTARPPGKNP